MKNLLILLLLVILSIKLLYCANGYILQAGTIQQPCDTLQMLCLCSFTRHNKVCKFTYEHEIVSLVPGRRKAELDQNFNIFPCHCF